MECVSPGPLAANKPLPEPEDLSDIESDDDDQADQADDEKEDAAAVVNNKAKETDDSGVENIVVKQEPGAENEQIVTALTEKEMVVDTAETEKDDVDAVSDVSLSDAEESSEKQGTTEDKNDPTETIKKEIKSCNKCDVPHLIGEGRCSFLLSSSNNSNNSNNSSNSSRVSGRVRTLPSDLYHNPDKICSREYRVTNESLLVDTNITKF